MHSRIIIIGGIQNIIDALNGFQPDTGFWEALKSACEAVDDAIQTTAYSNGQKNRMHHKLHEVQEFLEAGEPYNLEQVQVFTDELNGML